MTKMHLLDFGEDIITKITEDMDIETMVAFLRTNKILFNMHRSCIKTNISVQKYAGYDDTESYISVLFKSKNGPLNQQVMKTNKLVQYAYFKGSLNGQIEWPYSSMTQYYNDMIVKQYSSKLFYKHNYHLSMIYDKIWYKSNISIYDYYRILHLCTQRKYRLLEDLMLNMEFLDNKNNVINTLSITIDFFISLNGKTGIKAILLYVIYAYIDCALPHLFDENVNKNKKFLQTIIAKQRTLVEEIKKENIKLPKYITSLVNNKMLVTTQNIMKRCIEDNITI